MNINKISIVTPKKINCTRKPYNTNNNINFNGKFSDNKTVNWAKTHKTETIACALGTAFFICTVYGGIQEENKKNYYVAPYITKNTIKASSNNHDVPIPVIMMANNDCIPEKRNQKLVIPKKTDIYNFARVRRYGDTTGNKKGFEHLVDTNKRMEKLQISAYTKDDDVFIFIGNNKEYVTPEKVENILGLEKNTLPRNLKHNYINDFDDNKYLVFKINKNELE